MTSSQELTPDAESALNVVKTLLASLSNALTGRAEFNSTLHPKGHMAHARYSRVKEPVFHNFDQSSPDSLQAFVGKSGLWGGSSNPDKGWMSANAPKEGIYQGGVSGDEQGKSEKTQLPGTEEQIAGEATVMVDHDIAMVWTPYFFRNSGKLSHVGTNIFNLIKVYKDGDVGGPNWEWKIVTALDTARDPTEEERQKYEAA